MRCCKGNMKEIIVSLLCFLASSSADKDARIVGGNEAGVSKYTYVTGLRDSNGNRVCSGAVLSPRWIISAANCAQFAALSKVALGSNSATNQTIYEIENIISHPDYSSDVAANDIALVKISQNIVMQPGSAETISIAQSQDDLPTDANMTFAGWGVTNRVLSTYPNDLQAITYKLWSASACWKKSTQGKPRQLYSSETQMCAAAKNGKAGACYGDFGGPLVFNGSLYGIASKLMNKPCASGYPDIFTKVSYYKTWIENVMNSV